MHKFAWIALVAMCPPAVFGWGTEGHALIARIAEAQLTPAARRQLTLILGPGKTIVSVASWPDEIRRSRPETGTWHYVDIPIDKPHLDMARDCPKGECVIAKIEEFEKVLANRDAPPEQRREALMFVIHFIGDMHQPMHASNNEDRGGNSVAVQLAGRRTNLHSLWDSGLLSRMGKEDNLEPVWAKDSAKHAKKWSKGSVEDWAEQSHKEAQKVAYRKLPAGQPVAVNAAYEKAGDALTRMQIEKAGARLAGVLNRILQ
jgi:nuclease S1